MTLTLEISPGLSQQLDLAASRAGASPTQFALQAITQAVATPPKPNALTSLFQKWEREYDDEEIKETGEALIESLDQDRPSNRKLFPENLRGVTW